MAGTGEPDEVDGHQARTLVEELEEGVLAIGTGLTPHHRAGGDIHRAAIEPHALAIALHVELLQVSGEPTQLVGVGQHGLGLGTEDIVVPDAEHAHDHRGVDGER